MSEIWQSISRGFDTHKAANPTSCRASPLPSVNAVKRNTKILFCKAQYAGYILTYNNFGIVVARCFWRNYRFLGSLSSVWYTGKWRVLVKMYLTVVNMYTNSGILPSVSPAPIQIRRNCWVFVQSQIWFLCI